MGCGQSPRRATNGLFYYPQILLKTHNIDAVIKLARTLMVNWRTNRFVMRFVLCAGVESGDLSEAVIDAWPLSLETGHD